MMKRYIIWILIALMAVALIGIIFIQTRWISWSINLNEEKFDKEVFSALNHVEKDLAASQNSLDFDILADVPSITPNNRSKLDFFYQKQRLEDSLLITEDLSQLFPGNRSSFQQKLTLLEGLQVNKLLQGRALSDRLDIKRLNLYLARHLSRRGIDIAYHYGVFSNESNSFIILDGNFVVEEEGSEQYSNTPINQSLFNSRYHIDLFPPAEGPAPGVLFIDFPQRNRILFRDVWPTILGSVIFTAIILFCFVYTLHVILRQKKLSEMKTDFINNMTHEFKTPIATINLAADSITSPSIVGEPNKIGRFAKIIKQENTRLLSQVEKVLQMALLDKKDFKLKLTEINLHDVIVQAVEHANLQAEQKGGRVIANLTAPKPSIMGDQTHISNIIHNLLDNANKYSPNQPVISVATRNLNGSVEVVVEDQGIGMTKDQLKHIFDKFYRVHTGNLHDIKGFGLGLSYVKAMVLAHRGTIEVDSEIGEGSRFILKFPVNGGQEKEVNSVS